MFKKNYISLLYPAWFGYGISYGLWLITLVKYAFPIEMINKNTLPKTCQV